jgi:hypothetical protein
VVVELPQEKTPELRIKEKKQLRTNEKNDMAQSSGRKTRSAQEKQIPVPTSESSRRKTRHVQEKQILVSTSESKKKKRRLFEEEISTPDSKPNEASGPARRTTRSMAKQVIVPHIPSFLENPVDILTSPKKEDVHVEIISETEELVTETLKDLRKEVEAREEVNEKATLEPVSSLTKHQLVIKIERLQRQNVKLKEEVEEYKFLDRYIKKENAQLKEYN